MIKCKEYTIAQICSVITGAIFRKSEFAKEGIPVIKTANIKSNKINFNKLSYVSDSTAQKYQRCEILYNDILFTMTGNQDVGNPNYWVGRVAVFKEKKRYMLNQRLCIIRPNKELVDADFLAYYLSSVQTQSYFMNLDQTSGKQTNILLSKINECRIKLPNMTMQKRIAEILKEIDSKIAGCEEEINNLEEQAAAYYDELFIQNQSTAWKKGTLSDIGTIISGGTPSKEKKEYFSKAGIPWITPKDLVNKKVKFISHGKTDISELGLRKSSASKMPEGTVLFSSRAPIGYMAIAANELTTNQGFRSVIPNKNVGTAFTYYLLKHLLPAINERAVGGPFKEISGNRMKTVPVIIPDDDTLNKFNDFCKPLFERQRNLEKEKYRLELMRGDVLPKFISGEYDVDNFII